MEKYNFSYQLFTIKDIEEWLFHNVDNGLSDSIISRPRALAFVKNPHSKPNDAAVSAVFNEKNEPIGYTGAFAEEWVRPKLQDRYFWGSTQWMDPQYRGKGVSGKMMRVIKDAVDDRYIALDSSIASCRLDEKQGSVISYYPRYFVVLGKGSPKNLKSFIKERIVSRANKKALKKLQSYSYSNQYVNWIDDETYDFIVSHSSDDLFLRKQDFLNWQIRHPFVLSIGGGYNIKPDCCEFGGYVGDVRVMMVRVFVDDLLCGFYVLNKINSICTPLYLYYDNTHKDKVFASLLVNVLSNNDIKKIRTFDKDLFVFMQDVGVRSMFSNFNIENVSLTVPAGFSVDPSLKIQGGDGDMVC